MTTSTNDKIAALRDVMKKHKVDAVIIPSTDPHMGEYIPEHWAERTWISGFTGSAGTVVITMDFAGLWTDSRYFLQAEDQLSNSEMRLVKLKVPHTPEHVAWIGHQLTSGAKVAINGLMVPINMIRLLKNELEPRKIIVEEKLDFISEIWHSRPMLPIDLVMDHSIAYCGESRTSKLERIRANMKELGATTYLLATLDEIAWVFNLRGSDVEFNPLFVSYAIITSEKTILFINPAKLHKDLKEELKTDGITVLDYHMVFSHLAKMDTKEIVLLDPGRINYALFKAIPNGIKTIEGLGIATQMKAIKNETELNGLRQAMIKDGIAWIKFQYWLDQSIGKLPVSELLAANKLDEFRTDQDLYMGPSFHPISSYGSHGAVVHYAVDEESDIELKPGGIYLCDTGGHYLDGTTDTTRTISLGKPTPEQKRDFTLAFKGTLAVSMLRFPRGTKGYQMDILARMALWEYGKNYGHGTGHGVGFYLNVHEGPQTIGTGASGNMNTAMEIGMVTTVEPAIYKDGAYGMRTENMTIVVEDSETKYGTFYAFETITLVPYDQKLLSLELLTTKEIDWINQYHQKVFTLISPHLSQEESAWLKEQTKKI